MDVRWSQLFLRITLFVSSTLHFTATFKQQGTCYFPERWQGTWFQSGVRQSIVIEGSRLSSKGRCLGSEGDKFLLVDDKRACYRCVVIHEKHANVLQYKETFCHDRDSLPTLCSLITGDALLYSMFREDGAPVPCPFRGPFTFTYNRGHGECRSPVSSIDSCTEDSKLLLSYQACPDVHGSESTVEELQCLASWKEGSSRYLVGKVHHSHATSNEDRFRCFVYEKMAPASESVDGVDYRVAQSGDATCNGLFSATEGSRTMTLRRGPSMNKCRFPLWAATFSHWHTLDFSAAFSFHHRNSTLRISNSTSGGEMKVVCVQQKHGGRDESHTVMVTHFMTGCQSGYTCMSFYRRDAHVIEIQMGAHTKRQEDACGAAFFNRTALPYVTLVTPTPVTKPCPYMGKFDVDSILQIEQSIFMKYTRQMQQQSTDANFFDTDYFPRKYSRRSIREGHRKRRVKRLDQSQDCDSSVTSDYPFGALVSCSENAAEYFGVFCTCGFSSLVIGCNNVDTMEFNSECAPPDLITSYSCHGRWEENGTSYLITTPLARLPHTTRWFCFIYKETAPYLLFSTSAGSCSRSVRPGVSGELVFNVTSRGKCMVVNTSAKPLSAISYWVFPIVVSINILNYRYLLNIER